MLLWTLAPHHRLWKNDAWCPLHRLNLCNKGELWTLEHRHIFHRDSALFPKLLWSQLMPEVWVDWHKCLIGATNARFVPETGSVHLIIYTNQANFLSVIHLSIIMMCMFLCTCVVIWTLPGVFHVMPTYIFSSDSWMQGHLDFEQYGSQEIHPRNQWGLRVAFVNQKQMRKTKCWKNH